MQVVCEKLDELKRKITITVPAEQVEKEMTRQTQQAMRKAKLPGFRQGKVPVTVIEREFGPSIQFESLSAVVRSSFPQALQQEAVVPVRWPQVEPGEFQRGQPFSYTAVFEVLPKLTLKPFSELVIEKAVAASPSEEDIEQTLQGMRAQRRDWETVTRPAAMGDRVWIDFSGTVDGQPFEGGSAQNQPFILGAKRTIAGFEEGLAHHQVGETFDLPLTFPQDYAEKTLAGKPVVFNITLHKVEQPILPELDDAFAQYFGIEEGGVAKLRDQIRETLTEQCENALRKQLKDEVMRKLHQAYVHVSLPQVLIDEEAQNLRQNMEKRFKEAMHSHHQMPGLELAMFTASAKERVLLGLVLQKIIAEQKLKPEAARVRRILENMAAQFNEIEAAKMMEYFYRDQERLEHIENLALEDQIVDKILAEATVVEKLTSLQEVLKSAAGAH